MNKLPNPLSKLDTRTWWSSQGRWNLSTFLVGAVILGLAVLLGLWFLSLVFLFDKKDEWEITKIIILGLASIIGMIVSLINVRRYNNQALPKVAIFYAWLCSAFSLIVYFRLMVRMYNYDYLFPERYSQYLFAVGIIQAAVLVLPILEETYSVRSFAIPILIGNFFHLLMMLYHYLFVGIKPVPDNVREVIDPNITPYHYFAADIGLFLFMLAIALWMLSKPRLLVNIKRLVDNTFQFSD